MKNLGIALALAGALLVTSGNTLKAAEPASVAGAWIVQVTLRDCTTQAPLGPPFNSLVTFHSGGTISEAAGSLSFAAGQRSPGHGSWHNLGQYYSQRMVAQILFDTPANLPGTPGFDPSKPVTPGFDAGWAIVSHAVSLTDPNHLSSFGINQFYKTDGTMYRSGCSTATGVRFE